MPARGPSRSRAEPTTCGGWLYVGYEGSGTYGLSGSGYLSVAGNENVGYTGTGTFTQSGGTHNIGQQFYIGYEGQRRVQPQRQRLFVGERQHSPRAEPRYYGEEYLGSYGTGTFTQSGGTNSCIDLSLGGGHDPRAAAAPTVSAAADTCRSTGQREHAGRRG